MKSYIPLETAAILVIANQYLKQHISSEYVMVDLICMRLLDLWETRTKNYKMENSWQQWDSDLGDSTYEANELSVDLLELIYIDHLKVAALYTSVLLKVTYVTC